MSGTEARTTDGGPTGNTEIRDEAGSAAERLGGPLEDEQARDTTGEAEADETHFHICPQRRPPSERRTLTGWHGSCKARLRHLIRCGVARMERR